MAVSQCAIVYSTGNRHIRRWLFLDDDSHYSDPALLGPGESLHLISIGSSYPHADAMLAGIEQSYNQNFGPDQWRAQQAQTLATALGVALGDPHCAVVNTLGQVVAVIMADPAIDTYHADPTAQLIADPTHSVGIGWTWTQLGGFIAPLVVVGPPRTGGVV